MDPAPIIVAVITGLFAVLTVIIRYLLERQKEIQKISNQQKKTSSSINTSDVNRKIRSLKIAFIVSCIIIVVLGATLVFLIVNPSASEPKGDIAYPFEGSNVNLNETIRGTSQNIPEGQEMWVVVKLVGYRYYPAESTVDFQTGGDWSSFVWIGEQKDVGRQFDIILVLADKGVQDTFNTYVAESSTTHIWAGIDNLPESAKVLDSITVTRK